MGQARVYSFPGSPFGRAVLAALVAKNADFRLVPVRPGTFREPDNLARHPFGKVPSFEHDGLIIYETQAIMRYIDRVFPDPPLVPADPRDAARMDQALCVVDCYLFPKVGAPIGFNRVISPRLLGKPGDEAAVAAALPMAQTTLDALEALLGSAPWFGGNRVSLADLLVFPLLDFIAGTPEWPDLIAPRARLAQWMTRAEALDCMRATSWEAVSAMVA